MRQQTRIDKNSISYIRGRFGFGSPEYLSALKSEGKSKPVLKKVAKEVVKEIVKEELKKEVKKLAKEVINNPQPMKGETPLEFAKRRRTLKLMEKS